jgi:predicted anti-sigma-YlaC factor YlaD
MFDQPDGKGPKVPTCRDMSELVTDYLERAVSLHTRLSMWRHLVRCEACRRYYEQMRYTVRLLGSRRPAPPDRTTEESLLGAVHGQRRTD